MPKVQVSFSDEEAAFIDAMCTAMGLSKSDFVSSIVREELRRMMREGELDKWTAFRKENQFDED